jgi:hypothetical protein
VFLDPNRAASRDGTALARAHRRWQALSLAVGQRGTRAHLASARLQSRAGSWAGPATPAASCAAGSARALPRQQPCVGAEPYKTYTLGSAIAARTGWRTVAFGHQGTGGGLGGATKNHEAQSATRQAMPRSGGASGGTSSSSVVGQVTVGKGSRVCLVRGRGN